jgi:phage FluMu protein Com
MMQAARCIEFNERVMKVGIFPYLEKICTKAVNKVKYDSVQCSDSVPVFQGCSWLIV